MRNRRRQRQTVYRSEPGNFNPPLTYNLFSGFSGLWKIDVRGKTAACNVSLADLASFCRVNCAVHIFFMQSYLALLVRGNHQYKYYCLQRPGQVPDSMETVVHGRGKFPIFKYLIVVLDRGHFYLLHVNVGKCSVEYLNSGQHGLSLPSSVTLMMEKIGRCFPNTRFKLEQRRISQQPSDSNDCGICVLLLCRRLIVKASIDHIDFSAANLNRMRLHMANEVYQQRIILQDSN
jgi:hypothetical protein